MSTPTPGNFKSDLRESAEQMKAAAIVTGLSAVVPRETAIAIYASKGVTAEQVTAVRAAEALIGNAADLAAGEMGLPLLQADPNLTADSRFTLAVTGVGKDIYQTVVHAQREVGVGTKETRPLQLSSARWDHHGGRPAVERTEIKTHLTQLGQPLLAAIAKAQA